MSSAPELFSLAGRRALVTGASRGIGRAIALGLAEAGADVAVISRSRAGLEAVADEIRALGRDAVAAPCDVTQPDQIARVVQDPLEAFGEPDILVNNAGGPVFNAPFLQTRPEGWLRVLQLNVLSVVFLCQAIGGRMVERGAGSVINVDSIGAAHPSPLVTPYCAAKAAVVNLTQALAQEWGPAGVRVNALSPGVIDTDINRALVEHPVVGPAIGQAVPLGRWGAPGDLVGTAVWLASDASAYVSGAHVCVDGGLAVVAPQRPRDTLPSEP